MSWVKSDHAASCLHYPMLTELLLPWYKGREPLLQRVLHAHFEFLGM